MVFASPDDMDFLCLDEVVEMYQVPIDRWELSCHDVVVYLEKQEPLLV
jgi:hypothetical protein